MRIAQARELITPVMRTGMSGYASRTEEFMGIHDDIYVKVLYLENKGTSMAFITFDLCHYLYELNEDVMSYASEVLGVPYENVIVNYSHTHAGPKITSPTEKEEPSPLHPYFLDRARKCIERASLNIFEGTLQYARTSGRWNVNRRLGTPDGFKMRPNHNAITDDELNLLLIRDLEGIIRTVIVNYSCHPVTLSATLYLSSEYPGRVCQLLESEYYGAMAFFLQGAAGNMRPLVTADKGSFKACSFRELDEFSKDIANEVKRAVHSEPFEIIEPEFTGIKFSIRLETDPLPVSFFEEKLPETSGYLTKRMSRIISKYDEMDNFADIHCGIVKLNDDLFIPYMGGEIVVEIKELTKDVFSPANIIFLGYHEALTYIPDDNIIDEGGYEGFDAPTYAGFKGPFRKGVNEKICNAFSEALKKL